MLHERLLAPGEKVEFSVVLNAPGGYVLERPGEYQIKLEGYDLNISDSNTIAIVIEP
jgi:hypothetical protein